jgi:hypothetical protein
VALLLPHHTVQSLQGGESDFGLRQERPPIASCFYVGAQYHVWQGATQYNDSVAPDFHIPTGHPTAVDGSRWPCFRLNNFCKAYKKRKEFWLVETKLHCIVLMCFWNRGA